MSDRETLTEIFKIMKRLLLVPLNGTEPIPRKGTTRHECYRALYQIQELLGTNRFFANLPPKTNADRIRGATDKELAKAFVTIATYKRPSTHAMKGFCLDNGEMSETDWLSWLKSPVEVDE